VCTQVCGYFDDYRRGGAAKRGRDRYTHAMLDYGEIDRPKLLERVRAAHILGHTSEAELALFAGKF
jgi:hypothetical protein